MNRIQDIKARGLLQPIVLDAEGRVLDRRNRLAACEIAGAEPDFVTYTDGDPDGYALPVNINRRHLKPGARHLITEMARRRTGTGTREAARDGKFSPNRLVEAGLVLDYAKEHCAAVIAGLMGLERAAEVGRERKEKETEIAKKLARLEAGAPDLRDLVDAGRLDIDEALSLLESRED